MLRIRRGLRIATFRFACKVDVPLRFELHLDTRLRLNEILGWAILRYKVGAKNRYKVGALIRNEIRA